LKESRGVFTKKEAVEVRSFGSKVSGRQR